ncbi:MAG TPA: hypothetical protein VGS23_07990 [Thermoplasmata archaeon]|nr:hypothetical protein [Thermoplasmata archaeon]
MDSRVGLAIVVAALAATPTLLPNPHPGSSGYPVVPVASANELVSALSAPTLAPGDSGAISLVLRDPFSGPMAAVTLTLELYAFAPFPGNGSSPLPTSGAPVLTSGSPNGSTEEITIARLGAGGEFRVPGNASAPVVVPPGAPSGTFALRLALSFAEGNQSYLFESRGFFSEARWENATELLNGSSTINDSRLGISGVVPETAILVRTNPPSTVLYGILGGSLVLAAIGGYLLYRRGPGSRAGRWSPPGPQRAPSAFGNKRTSDGD